MVSLPSWPSLKFPRIYSLGKWDTGTGKMAAIYTGYRAFMRYEIFVTYPAHCQFCSNICHKNLQTIELCLASLPNYLLFRSSRRGIFRERCNSRIKMINPICRDLEVFCNMKFLFNNLALLPFLQRFCRLIYMDASESYFNHIPDIAKKFALLWEKFYHIEDTMTCMLVAISISGIWDLCSQTVMHYELLQNLWPDFHPGDI